MRLIAAVLLAALVGCAAQPDPAVVAVARDQLFDCHTSKARTLDDRQSDAATIGRAVHRACLQQASTALWATMPRNQPQSYINSYADEFMRMANDHATQVVLEARAGSSK